jgi:hypothetical protein
MSAYPCDLAATIAVKQIDFLDYREKPPLFRGVSLYINIKRYIKKKSSPPPCEGVVRVS